MADPPPRRLRRSFRATSTARHLGPLRRLRAAPPLLLSALCACGGVDGPAPTNPERLVAPVTARGLLPLEHDTVFSYETETDAGEVGLMILQIRRPRSDLAELDVAGRVQRLDIDATSVMHASGGYLLKDPIRAGATFQGSFGLVTILETGQQVHLPAGTFDDCVLTREQSERPFKRADSTYCLGVGLVSLVVEASGDADVLRVETRLKSHGPRVSLR